MVKTSSYTKGKKEEKGKVIEAKNNKNKHLSKTKENRRKF